MTKKIPYSKQSINSKDISNVIDVLKSDFLTTGPTIQKFEKKICKYLKTRYAVCVNSATSALHLACLSLSLKKNDLLLTSTNSFVASANCGKLCGAEIDLLDISLEDFNLSISHLEKKLKTLKKKPKIVIPVHLSGYPCDMKKIYNLSKKYNFKIVEDASHAFGSKYKKSTIGDCKFSDVAVFSFHPVKIFTSGEGGVLVTNNKEIYNKALMLRNHGITRDKKNFIYKKKHIIHYEQKELGFNYRMSDIHAALGISQLSRINFFSQKRKKIKKIYDKELKHLPFLFPNYLNDNKSSNHLYIVMIDQSKTTKKRDDLINFLNKKNIITSLHYMPIHMQPYYLKKISEKNFKNANLYYKNAISLPIYPELSKKKQNLIIKNIKSFFNNK